jgi:nucleoid-associated protein YgaU
MTSDAKIGLLLGLVFIFVIAFIINGLPNLRPQTTRAEVPTNMVSFPDQSIGIADRAQTQVNQDWNALAAEQETEQAVAERATPAVETLSPPPEAATGQVVRFEAPLPRIGNPLDRIENLLERLTAGQQSPGEQTVSTVNMNVPTAGPPSTSERQPAIQTGPSRTEIRPTETVTRSTESPRPSGTPTTRETTAPLKPLRIYVVGEGESLSTVAKNVYGPEEGNRYVNINRIYEANKDVLKSVNEVVAGQKLVIPALPKPAVNPNKPSDVLPKELFERLDSLRKPAATPTPAPSGDSRWYTVQDGDNLWKIASSQLGAGARYEEIAKLNADLLKDREKLDVGMKIRLPLK